jgi:hypothetical protein
MSDKQPEHTNGHLDHEHVLDIRDPEKWQMKVRMYLEAMEDPDDAERWMEGIRLIATMSGRVVRDQVYKRATTKCYVCKRAFKDGRPAGEAFYFDAERQTIKIYCCDQSEYGDLLKIAKRKGDDVQAAEERAEKAVRKAAVDARLSNKAKEALRA